MGKFFRIRNTRWEESSDGLVWLPAGAGEEMVRAARDGMLEVVPPGQHPIPGFCGFSTVEYGVRPSAEPDHICAAASLLPKGDADRRYVLQDLVSAAFWIAWWLCVLGIVLSGVAAFALYQAPEIVRALAGG